jgi:predicted acylesterase/phospholipase RssA
MEAVNDILAKYKEIAATAYNNTNTELIAANKEPLNSKKYSDIKDKDSGHQYVNLIQEGAGVWGIALVGYTYILEMAGLRFLKMAGTSAGAINTIFLASMLNPEKGKTKSEKILELLSQLNMYKFVDGHWFVSRIIRHFIINEKFLGKLLFSLTFLTGTSLFLLVWANILQWKTVNFNAIGIGLSVIIALLATIAYKRGKARFAKDRGQPDSIDQILQTNISQKAKVANKILVLGTIAIIGFFLLGIIFNNLPISHLQYIDLAILVFILIAVAFLSDKLDDDKMVQFAMLFIIMAILGFGFGSVYTNYNLVASMWHITLLFLLLGVVSLLLHKQKWLPYVFFLLFLTCSFCILGNMYPSYSNFAYLSLAGLSFSTILIVIAGGFVLLLAQKFKQSQFGINPGRYFHQWLKSNLATFKHKNDSSADFTMKHLIENWENNCQSLVLDRDNDNTNIEDLKKYNPQDPQIVIIASEIATQNKVELPKMASAFWKNTEQIAVADFVRASMAIPIFFEPFVVDQITPDMIKTGKRWFGEDYGENFNKDQTDVLRRKAFFCDGGLLSNFPYSLFHKPKVKQSRIPTFGIRLYDSTTQTPNGYKSIGSYIWSIFNTTRYYFDKDFLIKNKYYEKCICEIDLKEFNWLNFFLSEKEKLEMFKKGVDEACKFLKNFDWEQFKKERDKGIAEIYG